MMTERFILGVVYENCTGCHICELACSYRHGGAFRPFVSRITVFTNPDDHEALPVYCLQCRNAFCAAACPTNAIVRDERCAYVVEHLRCIGCRECAYACPFGAIGFEEGIFPVKCDLCGGDPECVKVCPHDALIYGHEDVVMRRVRLKKATIEAGPGRREEAEKAVEFLMGIIRKP